jgi:hypothetical protein
VNLSENPLRIWKKKQQQPVAAAATSSSQQPAAAAVTMHYDPCMPVRLCMHAS